MSVADIERAREHLAGVVSTTPLLPNPRLSARAGARVFVKREDLQPVRSYKLRGAYNFMSQLSPEQRAAGVVTASAGNHGQGVAYACRELNIHGRIYVPATTPLQKRERMRAIGGDHVELVVYGANYDEAAAAGGEATSAGAIFVPAFDHPRTVAGQGTVAPEICDQLGAAPDVLVVPVGGGGLLAGCLLWFAEHAPDTRIVGVEPAGAASLAAALEAGRPDPLPDLDSFVDGAAVRTVGHLPYDIISSHPVELTREPEGQICSEMLEMYQVDGIIAEPAGALAASAVGHSLQVEPDQTVVVLVSGGNNDVSRYAEVVERSLIFAGLKHYFLVSFPQEPGALRRFLDEVLGPDDDIAHFEYVKRSNRDEGPALVGIEISRPEDLAGLIARMDASPIRCEKILPDSPFYRMLV
ncbi:threonine ammonia-lyase IlvA [Parenemella sanctibonifatiensis]|uniref:L-threonine dehydratase n=1 Tax=Parenemella sanctibonifatiensis TaxID=2016505 RepID=A0A255EE10_9ACTN|nr:threonine ammonia-lyase IlvA [Parenemella sanctibonifatiensis]OYN89181.1 threonine dehydratase [Parenemella sanctibonifatiensis]